MRGGKKRSAGGRLLFDLGPHVIDQALVLFGEPKSITASAFCQRETSKVDDSFDVCLEYPGLRAVGRARIIAYAPGPHFLIHGPRIVCEVWNGSAGGAAAGRSISSRHRLGSGLG